MASSSLRSALQHMCYRLQSNGEGALSDAHLLERWTKCHDEVAFELLLRRHGPMVFGVCRRLLGHTQDAEDAFQATFLVLVRKAGSIHKQTALGSWLYKVAYRAALRVRNKPGERTAPIEADALVHTQQPHEAVIWKELRLVLDEEVGRLPPRYRDVFILCHLEGKTNEEAARELGCPLGTVLSRLSRAREHLRVRLQRRGVEIGTGVLMTTLSQYAVSAAFPPALIGSALKNMVAAAGIPAAAHQLPEAVTTLTQGVIKTMFVTRIKILLTVWFLVALTGGTGTFVAYKLNAQEAGDAAQVSSGTPLPVAKKKEGFTLQLKATFQNTRSPIRSLAVSPDGKYLISGSDEGSVTYWDIDSGKLIRKQTPHDGRVTHVAFSPDGRLLVSSGLDGYLHIYDVKTGKMMSQIREKTPVFSMTLSPDGKLLASGGADNVIRIWSVPTGEAVYRLKVKDSGIHSLAFSPDGKALASGGEKTVRFWDVQTGKQLLVFAQQPVKAQAMTISPDGKYLASGGDDGSIQLLHVRTGKILRKWKAHDKAILSLAFSPDAKTLASSSSDKTIRLWNVATAELLFKVVHAFPVTRVIVSPDGHEIISATKDGKIKIWRVVTKSPNVSEKNFATRVIKGRFTALIKELVRRKKSDEQCVEAICLAALGRFPTGTELKLASRLLKENSKREDALQEILSTFVATKEFGDHLSALQQHIRPGEHRVIVVPYN